ncbi:Bro-N domain-containing protein [Alishewanella aestuarii]|uniref:BRO-N domain-containing protein n=1 Tax=Alishewanella aestuarii TaxID=453835 RepID=UPI0006872B21|nr:BRO family protein [Alishewanella aestuarii]
MENDINSIILTYPEGGSNIRTLYRGEDVLFSLHDIVALLAKQNSELAKGGKSEGLMGLIKAQIEVLEPDEKEGFGQETYVTQPGLFRIILRDNSPACKRFQRWVTHEVLPSIQKYGTYPPPILKVSNKDSDVKRLVQALLIEIEERERLEVQTKQKFLEHEERLNHLGSMLEAVKSEGKFIDVESFCKSHEIDSTHYHLILSWCIKICAEQDEPSAKKFINGKTHPAFPEYVLIKAAEKALKR